MVTEPLCQPSELLISRGDCPRKNSGGAVDLLRSGGRGKDAASPWKEINGIAPQGDIEVYF